jgi:hypothetical protein
MAFNLIKNYNELLEIVHLSEPKRLESLRRIFDRDFTNNEGFNFRTKLIRPYKNDGAPNLDTIFFHLTHEASYKVEDGKTIKSRDILEYGRSQRLHWVRNHIEEKNSGNVEVFSYTDRVDGKDKIRTYLYDVVEEYIIILEPLNACNDYYLISAYPLTKAKGGIKQIKNKSRNRLPDIH